MTARVGWLLGALAALVAGAGLAATGTTPPPAPSGVDGGAPAAPSPTVKILFQTVPPEKAVVLWGRKPLGWIKGPKKPLTIERPRDSGPMDVVVKSEGFLPVHTRAYTFSDAKVFIKLTPIEEKKTILGYREELPDAGPEAGPAAPVGPPGPDAGAPVGPPLPPR